MPYCGSAYRGRLLVALPGVAAGLSGNRQGPRRPVPSQTRQGRRLPVRLPSVPLPLHMSQASSTGIDAASLLTSPEVCPLNCPTQPKQRPALVLVDCQ
jgi:hypothetical protein